MLQEQWDFVQEMEDRLPPRRDLESRSEYIDNISEYLLHIHPGDETSTVKTSAKCCAYVLGEILLDGKNVVTPQDIDAAIEYGKSNIPGHAYVTRLDVESWFANADLVKVEREYVRSSTFAKYKYIYVAPIVPTVEDLLEALGNPLVLSQDSIEIALHESFVPEEEPGSDSHVRKINSDNLAAFSGLCISRIETAKWGKIAKKTSLLELWFNSGEIDRALKAEGKRHSGRRITALTDGIISENIPGDLEDEIDIASIRPYVLNDIYEKYGWKVIIRSDGTTWYSSDEQYKEEFLAWVHHFQDIAKEGREASNKALEAAKLFFEKNSQDILREFKPDPKKLAGLIDQIEGDITAKRLLELPESAMVGPSDDDIKSEVVYEIPPFREVAREYERKLEERQEEELELDDSIADFEF